MSNVFLSCCIVPHQVCPHTIGPTQRNGAQQPGGPGCWNRQLGMLESVVRLGIPHGQKDMGVCCRWGAPGHIVLSEGA
jgi:hypothetical protein